MQAIILNLDFSLFIVVWWARLFLWTSTAEMVRNRKSSSAARDDATEKQREVLRLRLWNELGGWFCGLEWTVADHICRDMATVSPLSLKLDGSGD